MTFSSLPLQSDIRLHVECQDRCRTRVAKRFIQEYLDSVVYQLPSVFCPEVMA